MMLHFIQLITFWRIFDHTVKLYDVKTFTTVGINLKDRVLGEVELNSFIVLPCKGDHRWLMPKIHDVLPTEFKELGVVSSWTFFWLVGDEVIESQHRQPSSCNWSEVYKFVGSIQLTSSTWWIFQYLQNSSKDMGQNIIYSLWGRNLWPCLAAEVLLFCLAWFSFLYAFLTSLIKSILCLKSFYRQKAGGEQGLGWGWDICSGKGS